MIKKKIIIIVVSLLIILALMLLVFMNRVHTVTPVLIKEYTSEQEIYDTYGDNGYCYFFVQSDKHYCFNGDGVDELKIYAPNFDLSSIDTDKYSYIVAINCEINSLTYSRKTAFHITTFGIDTYISDADLTKTHDSSVRIYKMKKVNIDYNFTKYGPHGTNFEFAR